MQRLSKSGRFKEFGTSVFSQKVGRSADRPVPSPLRPPAVVRLNTSLLSSVGPNLPKACVVPVHCSAHAFRNGRSRLRFSLSQKTIGCDQFHISTSKPSNIPLLAHGRQGERDVTIVFRNPRPRSGRPMALILRISVIPYIFLFPPEWWAHSASLGSDLNLLLVARVYPSKAPPRVPLLSSSLPSPPP